MLPQTSQLLSVGIPLSVADVSEAQTPTAAQTPVTVLLLTLTLSEVTECLQLPGICPEVGGLHQGATPWPLAVLLLGRGKFSFTLPGLW